MSNIKKITCKVKQDKAFFTHIEVERTKFSHRDLDSIDICFWRNGYGNTISNLTVEDLKALKRAVNKSLKLLGYENNKRVQK